MSIVFVLQPDHLGACPELAKMSPDLDPDVIAVIAAMDLDLSFNKETMAHITIKMCHHY